MEKRIGSALVVGAGISGIRSALDLAGMDYRVILIDRAPNMGGVLRQLDHQFPDDHCGMCKMLPMADRDAASQYCLRKGFFHRNIEVMLSTEMTALEGEPGKFKVTLRTAPGFIDPALCIGCGECSRVCPVEAPDAFNAGLSKRKAVYLPVPHNIPNRYVIDAEACTRCGECEKACPAGAIDLKLEARRAFRVLVVDDELVVRDSLKEWLQVEGFGVDMAESGPEALEYLSGQEYNLMLLDIKMPGMDGVEVLKAAKEMRPELPVVMMTAYATVETAVEAMKSGAREYLMKPFDIEALLAMVELHYQAAQATGELEIEVGAVILSSGSALAGPADRADTYHYGVLPNIVSSIEFERIISGSGPTGGKLVRPGDGGPVRKIGWLQCTGSRNLQVNADYCSSICCMFSIKEAVLAKRKAPGIDAAIFYMDMRTYGKDFQRYRDAAEHEHGVRFVRTRVHSVLPEPDGSLRLSYADPEGSMHDEAFDLIVLAAGQRPPAGMELLAEMTGIELNQWGFCKPADFSPARTSREGVFAGGSFSGLRDISESVIQASAASLEASKVIHAKGGGIRVAVGDGAVYRDVSREPPSAVVAVCAHGGKLMEDVDLAAVASGLKRTGAAAEALVIERMCTQAGWESLLGALKGVSFNRLLIGACMPCVYGQKLHELGEQTGLDPVLMDAADIVTPALSAGGDSGRAGREITVLLEMALARLRNAEASRSRSRKVVRKALIAGGGIAGMTAALAIADHGFDVHLVEREKELGGLLRRLHRTIEGAQPAELLGKTISAVEAHPNIHTYKGAAVIHSQGQAGDFLTTLELEDGAVKLVDHGVAIIATGGAEAKTDAYCHGQAESILTQHELEAKLYSGAIDPTSLKRVAMIQCVGSREAGRNYCSRICCSSALKNALYLKEKNPELDIYILYRDIMAYGFLESFYTRARREGIVFIQYSPERQPVVTVEAGALKLTAHDPILGREIVLDPDLLVLSTGVVPKGQERIAEIFGLDLNEDGFLREAEYKWRPVDFIKFGVFMCGIAHSPRSVPESIAMAEAAAQRALAILSRSEIKAASVVAEVRHSLCSLCERCLAACPYGARRRDEDEETIEVDALLCQGCGSCAAVCPNSASVLRGYLDRQVMGMLDAALG